MTPGSFIVTNVRSKLKEAEPFAVGFREERIALPYQQAVVLTREQTQNAINHFAASLRVQTPEDWQRENKGPSKILILRSQGIGDILLLTPAIRKLAKEYNEVHVGLRPDIHATLSCAPYVTKLWNHAIDGTGNAPQSDPSFLATIDANMWSEANDPDRATYHRTLSLAKKLGVTLGEDEREPDLFCDPQWLEDGRELIGKGKPQKARYLGIQLVASHSYRDFWCEHNKGPFPKHEALIKAAADAGWIPVLFAHYRKIEKPDKRAIDLQGTIGLDVTIGAINACDAFVGSDSGLVHIAAALGVPVVGMFGICSPQYRMTYYRGPHVELTRVPCIGCGDYAMQRCKHPHDEDGACMKFPVAEIIKAVGELGPRVHQAKIGEKRKAQEEKPKAPAIIIPGESGTNGRGLWMTMMFQDESKEHMERFADRVISHKAIEHVVAVDGGCQTGANHVLDKIGKVEVHHICYCREFFNAQAHQRNACFSFVRDGQPAFFMDPDEAFGGDMASWLGEFSHLGIDYGLVARATWDTEDEARLEGHRSPGTHNWPDYQPRFYRWRRTFHFDGAAHHVTLGCPEPTRIDTKVYLWHYEEEGGKVQRMQREAQWATMMAKKRAVCA